MTKRILVDMDGVLADFDAGILNALKVRPDITPVKFEDRKEFYTDQDYPEEHRPAIKQAYASQGFFYNLPPIEGSIEALTEISNLAEVFICTAPLSGYDPCVLEKFKWVEKHLGKGWTKKIVLTKDKTIVSGDYLIDDRPDVTGVAEPTWEHLLYDRPYNQNVKDKRRITWETWPEVLADLLKKN